MARMRISDTCDLAREILNGDHDDILEYIQQAAQHRKKAMYRKGSLVNIIEGPQAGQVGVVIKVNPTRITVGVGTPVIEGAGSPWEYTTYSEGEWNYPPRMIRPATNTLHKVEIAS